MRIRRLAAALILLLAASCVAVQAVERFPRPEFDSGYELPYTTAPGPRSETMEVVDLVVLAGALAVAAHLALVRRSRRGLWLIALGSVLYFGFVREGCVCPIGAIQNVSLGLADSSVAVPAAVVGFFTLPLLFALISGRTFCSGVCPLGAIQDLVLLRPVKVPEWLAGPLGLLRHVYLGAAVLLAATGSMFLICDYDPFIPFFRLGGSWGHLTGGGAMLGLAVVVARPYCRFLCPYSVLLGWLSRLAGRRLQTSPEACIECRLCDEACPLGAIRRPVTEPAPESRQQGMRRLAVLLVLLPVVAAAAGWGVSRLDNVLARTHPKVRLAERMAVENAGQEEGTTLETRTFRAGGTPASDLESTAAQIRARFRRGGWWLGGFLGVVFMGQMISLSVRRTRTVYEPDPADCVSCGRCFSYCPWEQVRSGPGAPGRELPVLACRSHQLSAAGDDEPHPASLSRLGVLGVLTSTPPRPSGRKHYWAQHLAALATKPGEICRLGRRLIDRSRHTAENEGEVA